MKAKKSFLIPIIFFILFFMTNLFSQNKEEGLKPIEIKLPKALFIGTPQNIKVSNLEKPLGKPRPPFLAPAATKNLALNGKISSTDEEPIIGEIEFINDDDKEAGDGSFVELGPFIQHVTIDLKQNSSIYAILLWHFHKQPRVYFDVIVQVADDAAFTKNVQTLFNNDNDNSTKLGVGKDLNYVETAEGKLIDSKGVQARYVRCYSNGNTNKAYTQFRISCCKYSAAASA